MIVSDATVLITLINIDEFQLLKLFTEEIIIPHEVYAEVAKTQSAKKFLDTEIENSFITLASCTDTKRVRYFNYILDSGESASIVLALERNLPLIIDEKKGRNFAQKQGVQIIGLVGILRFLFIDGRVGKEEIVKIIEKLNRSSFRIRPELLEMILA